MATPVKTWPIPSRKPFGNGRKPKLAGIFDCPNCKTRFRAAVEVETKIEEKTGVKNVFERIRDFKSESMQTIVNLREKIGTLEIERKGLLVEIDKLKKVAESRANVLESEVGILRDEVKSLRDLLGYEEK